MIACEEDLMLKWEEESGYFNWNAVFGNDNPVEIEIGIGKGKFLLNRAEELPERNYLGIEWANKYVGIARTRAWKRELANIRFLRTDAGKFVERGIQAASIAQYHVYFPDPWPKRRHHKRRLFQPAFMNKVVESLVSRGLFALATDYRDYYKWSMEVMQANPGLKLLDSGGIAVEEGRTHYEMKYLKEGRPIYQAVFQKST